MMYADILRRCRKEAGYTQTELAFDTDVSVVSIRRYELGDNIPRLDRFEKLLDACGYKIEIVRK